MAAFINALHEEGTKQECLEWVVKLWNELSELRAIAHPIAEIAPVLEHAHDNMGIWSTGCGNVRVTLGQVRKLYLALHPLPEQPKPKVDPAIAKIVMMEPRT